MGWIQCYFPQENGLVNVEYPKKSGDYWVTDGWNVYMGHFHKDKTDYGSWGLYTTNKYELIGHCYSVDDMNFCVKAYAELEFPEGFENFQDL